MLRLRPIGYDSIVKVWLNSLIAILGETFASRSSNESEPAVGGIA